jgi:hypothetical protein
VRRPIAIRALSLAVVGTIVAATLAVPSAQRRGRADNAAQGVPVATSAIIETPDRYVGKLVTVSAGVEEMLSKTAFLLDQRKAAGMKQVQSIGKPLLVIAPYLTASFDRSNYLLVRGEVVKLDAAALARLAPGYSLDLAPDVGAKYQAQPVLVANSVIDSKFVELARKPIAPPSPADFSLTAAMKTISPAFTALRTAAQESKTDVVIENAAKLQAAFSETEAIWMSLSVGPAVKMSLDARGQAASIATAVAAGNWDDVKTSAAALNQTCQSCHAAHRERQDDGTFRLKK